MRYPGQKVQVDVKKVPRECVKGDLGDKYYQYIAIDEFCRLRYLGAFEQANTYSSEQFLMEMIAWFAKKNIKVECVQTDNGFEFTKRFTKTREERNLTLFEMRLESLGIRHKLIRPYTPGTMEKWSEAIGRIRKGSKIVRDSFLFRTSPHN